MIQKLAKMVAIVALALIPLIGSGMANAHDIGSGSVGFHNGGWHVGRWHRPCYLMVCGTTYCF